MPGQLAGRVVLISGAARGQGAAMAGLFVAEGASVVLADVLDATELAAGLGPAAVYRRLDVRDEEAWADAVSFTVERFGKLDGLVNNAGRVHLASIRKTTVDAYRDVVETNQFGVFLGMRAVIAPMRAAGGGTIVNVASVAGLRGMPALIAYCASKHAIVGMSKVAAMELGRHGIRVNTLCPGVVATEMTAQTGLADDAAAAALATRLPLGRIATPNDTARVALFLTGPQSGYSTGGEFLVDGGWSAGMGW